MIAQCAATAEIVAVGCISGGTAMPDVVLPGRERRRMFSACLFRATNLDRLRTEEIPTAQKYIRQSTRSGPVARTIGRILGAVSSVLVARMVPHRGVERGRSADDW